MLTMRFGRISGLLFGLALSVAGASAGAVTLPVIGGPGLDQGQICGVGALCPGSPIFSLIGTAAATGSFTYDPGAQTVDFTLTLAADANFGGALLLAGSTFSAAGVPVIAAPLGGGAYVISQLGAATGLASPVLLSPAFPLTQNTPAISGLTCTVGTGADQCGVSLGSGGLEIDAGGVPVTAFLTFNVNVPEPGTALLLVAGLAGLALASRRRA